MNTLNPIAVRLVSLWFMGTTFITAIGGTIWIVYTLSFVDHAAKAQGHIVAMQSTNGPHGNLEYSPVFSFNDASGIVHTQQCSMSSSSYSYEVGETVSVLYDPARPLRSNIDSFSTLWLGPLLMIGVSFVSGSFIAIILYALSRTRQSQS